jgi:integrase
MSRSVIGNKLTIDLATNMYNYALVAKPLFDEPFLTYVSKDGTRKWCNYQEYNALIKKIAIHCGFKDIHFSKHSLRRGGATLLALAGLQIIISEV